MADREKILYANVDWFTVPDELDETDFPEEITNARQMWENNSQKSSPELCSLIEKLIICQYLAENMSGWEEYFPDSNYCPRRIE